MSYSDSLIVPPNCVPRSASMLRSTLTVKLVILLSSVLALAQFRTVTVQNANSNPVPTTIQNSGPIPMTIQNDSPIATTVTNTPTVNAAITNTPTVTIKDTVPGQVSGIVNTAITNTPTAPLNHTHPLQPRAPVTPPVP